MVDTPGWGRNLPVERNAELVKQEIVHSGPLVRTFANVALLAPWPIRKLRTLWNFSLRRIYETCRSSVISAFLRPL